ILNIVLFLTLLKIFILYLNLVINLVIIFCILVDSQKKNNH
ncbi:hypothetical protein HMPREF9371_0324, partial [Neisseria shayeganii 871]